MEKMELITGLSLVVLVIIAGCTTVNYALDILVRVAGH